MKIVVILIGGILIAVYLLGYSSNPGEAVSTSMSGQAGTPDPGPENPAADPGDIHQMTADDARREEMAKAFLELKGSRAELKSSANLLKSRIWGLELPPAQAKDFSNKMKQAYVYLKNPPQLGAYFDVSDIERESRKVNRMMLDLKQLDTEIAKIKAGVKSED